MKMASACSRSAFSAAITERISLSRTDSVISSSTADAGISALLIASLLLAQSGTADEELDVRWSATLEGRFKVLEKQEANDDFTGFFDQWEYTPNKDDATAFQLDIPEASLDVFAEGDTPRLQFRLESPTSGLGVTGSDIDRPFLNQRADLFGRRPGVGLDLDYRRFRSDDLRFYSAAAVRLWEDGAEVEDNLDEYLRTLASKPRAKAGRADRHRPVQRE